MYCRHCEQRQANASRGLCKVCFADPAIREAYPPRHEQKANSRHEPTIEDIEAMIAKQMPTMPPGNDTGGERSPCGRILERAIEMGQRGRRVQRKAGRR